MTNSNDGAFGMAGEGGYQIGLTKRELFAAMAMKGALSALPWEYRTVEKLYDVVNDSVFVAGALIAALSKPTEATPLCADEGD